MRAPARAPSRRETRFRSGANGTIEDFAADGGLVAYGSSASETYQQVALYVDKILKGAKPADLPVTQSTRFTLTVNLAAARAIGLDIAPSFLTRADEVIE